MLDEGLNVTVNSDDPPMFATSLTEEYRWLARQGVSFRRLWACNLAAVEACFLDREGRSHLRERLRAYADSEGLAELA